MNKTFKLILTVGGIAAIWYLISKARAGKNLRVNFQNLKFGKFTGLTLPLELSFNIINGSNTPITVNSIVGEIFVNDRILSTVNNLDRFNIPGNSSVVYKTVVQTGGLDVINVVRNLIRNKQRIAVTFKGTVNSTGMMIPVEQTVFNL
jgi:LEA14-like dessication related protein